jgi:hypothetical protein
MSLINDALKRASQWDKDRPPQASLPRPMRPAPAERRPQNALLGVVIFIAVAALMFGGFFFWKWWKASHAAPVVAPVESVRTVIVQAPPPVVVSAPVPKPAPVVQQIPTPVVSMAPAPAKVAATNPVVLPHVPLKPTFPALTVKAIFYNKTSPWALVNGKTVEPGDKIDGALIKSIEQDRVVVTWNGETKELLMGAPR